MPWHFRDAILWGPLTQDGSDFVPDLVMRRAVDEFKDRLARSGPQPMTVDWLPVSDDTLQGYVTAMRIQNGNVVISGKIEDTAAGFRAQQYRDLAFGYSAVGVPEFDEAEGRMRYTSMRIIGIAAMDFPGLAGGDDE